MNEWRKARSLWNGADHSTVMMVYDQLLYQGNNQNVIFHRSSGREVPGCSRIFHNQSSTARFWGSCAAKPIAAHCSSSATNTKNSRHPDDSASYQPRAIHLGLTSVGLWEPTRDEYTGTICLFIQNSTGICSAILRHSKDTKHKIQCYQYHPHNAFHINCLSSSSSLSPCKTASQHILPFPLSLQYQTHHCPALLWLHLSAVVAWIWIPTFMLIQ